MSTAAVRSPHGYEDAYEAYYAEASEEVRAVRVGEKETSDQAAIVARHADLFTQEQLDALRQAEAVAPEGDERERIYRLRRTCEAGVVDAELAAREDELENSLLAARLTFDGEEMPLRAAEAKLSVLPDYAKREELGALALELSASFNDGRRELLVQHALPILAIGVREVAFRVIARARFNPAVAAVHLHFNLAEAAVLDGVRAAVAD